MTKPTYTAITIGPIYKTLSQARKTRELWGASYLFSFIMRKIIEGLGNEKKCCLPFHSNIMEDWKDKGAGLFPDRLIYEGDVSAAIPGIEENIIKILSDKSGLDSTYLQNYIRIYFTTYSLPLSIYKDDESIEKNNNIILVANKLLDALELKEKYYSGNISEFDWKKTIYELNKGIFYTEAFGDNKTFFPSIAEIATYDFKHENYPAYKKLVDHYINKLEEEDQDDFLNALKNSTEFGDKLKLRTYHKYIAVVQGDGDNIGKTIQAIGADKNMVQIFSSALFDFALAATDEIKKYGGKAVYVGGDDVLFFAPLAVFNENLNEGNGGLSSIFGLLGEIDQKFKKHLIDHPDLKELYKEGGKLHKNVPSMSYGVSITYSKYPLNEARDTAYALLQQAKSIKTDKNKICFKLHKHSGHSFGFTVDRNNRANAKPPLSFEYFIQLVNNIPLTEGLLLSISTKLAPLHVLLHEIGREKQRLHAFFSQEFEYEKLEKEINNYSLPANVRAEANSQLTFIKTIEEFYHQLCVDFRTHNLPFPAHATEATDSNIAKLYSTLRFIKHLTDEEDEQ